MIFKGYEKCPDTEDKLLKGQNIVQMLRNFGLAGFLFCWSSLNYVKVLDGCPIPQSVVEKVIENSVSKKK